MTGTDRFGMAAAAWVLVVVGATAGLVLAGVLLVHCAGEDEQVRWSDPVVLDGNVVRVSYVGSECRDHASVDVDESPERVVITVTESVAAGSCSDVGVLYTVDARLDAPLGDRELVDGS
ncbi:hypothetical protein H5V45_02485 [Nocardioides sp. KIGAM211]|uniref:DUF4307 domain-containing protein n=1 Tax=Nocardioides luti TaxID=2761101 RepID=A0A7X0RFQ1_9ACTN|nr:hypothetical protein [Nocardioides luti]MBB6626179.1 hypothetical protein [Nocardioides luti]